MSDVKWIKLKTDIFEDEKMLLIQGMPKGDTLIVIWIKMLCLAGKLNQDGYFLLSNEVPYDFKMLSTVLKRKENVVKNAVEVFKKYGLVEIKDGVISITNWNKHQSLQGFESRKEYMREYMKKRRSKQNVNESKVNSKPNVSPIDKEEDKDKEININNRAFVKPTVEEVRAYCLERNNGIDAETFISFYESKGWMIGKNKMKDWKAAVRTWERSRKPEKQDKPKFDSFSQREYDYAALESIATRRS